jgi:hypothetical protein
LAAGRAAGLAAGRAAGLPAPEAGFVALFATFLLLVEHARRAPAENFTPLRSRERHQAVIASPVYCQVETTTRWGGPENRHPAGSSCCVARIKVLVGGMGIKEAETLQALDVVV